MAMVLLACTNALASGSARESHPPTDILTDSKTLTFERPKSGSEVVPMSGYVVYFVIFAVAAVLVGLYTASRPGSTAGALWGVLVFLFGALGLIAWAIYF